MLKLKEERRRRGWTLVRVCQLTGIDPATLSRLERGHLFPYPGWRRRLAEAFGLPEEVLFEEVPENERDHTRKVTASRP